VEKPRVNPERITVAERDPRDELEAVSAELDRLLAADDWPGLARLAAGGALLTLGLGPADLASPAALGHALYRTRSMPAAAA
jgi:hypothetical protein